MPVKTYSIKRDGNIKLSANFTLKEMQSHDGATTATHTTDIEGLKAADAELVDIRTGLDGTKYVTAGTAVREQIKAVETKIDDSIATMEEFLGGAK